jgi:alpha-glucosidase
MQIVKKFESLSKDGKFYIVHTDNADIKIYFLTDEIIRIRASFDKNFKEESYVLSTLGWDDRLDNVLGEYRKKIDPIKPDIKEDEDQIIFETAKLKLVLDKKSIGFCLYDIEGDLLYSDLNGNPFILDSNNRVNHYSKMEEDECFYGFGEKAGILNKNKTFLRERATDAMGYDADKMDTLYKHIPFYIRMRRASKKAVGLFYHNFYESVFNMGCEKSNYWPRYTYFQADGGDIDLYLIGGNSIKRVVDNYTLLSGRPALLPKRALGYQGSSMYYPELEKDSDDAVLEFIDTVKEEGFPIDGFHLSSGYTSYNNKRCVFTWNLDRFKDPRDYFKKMNEKGAQNVPNVKPGILLMHPKFDEFVEKDVFVKDSEKDTYAIGSWWGGDGAFWDFTKADARKAWKEYLTENVIDIGTDSIWNDNCEYDSLLDKDTRVDFDKEGGTIGELKPLMSTIMCQIANEAVVEHNENARPYVVCRSGSAGIQKYAQTWCGDNLTNWTSLKYNIPIITGMGLSGQPNEGADIGGFAGPAPSEELFVRWVQNGIFQPRFSIHSASSDNTVTEPWMFKNSTDIIRDAINFRYKLTPYFYSLEYEASKSGSPIMRPLVYEFQNDENTFDESFEFTLGRDILVANVLEENAKSIEVYLPKGSTWYDYNDNFKKYEGGRTISIPVDISTIPMFIRSGAIIPMSGNKLTSMAMDKVEALELLVATGENRSFVLYDDDGVSNDFKKGVFKKTTIEMSGDEIVKLNFKSEGSYKDSIKTVRANIIKKEKSPYWVSLAGRKLPHFLNRRKFEASSEGWYYSQTNRSVEIKYANPESDYELIVSFEMFDLIGM